MYPTRDPTISYKDQRDAEQALYVLLMIPICLCVVCAGAIGFVIRMVKKKKASIEKEKTAKEDAKIEAASAVTRAQAVAEAAKASAAEQVVATQRAAAAQAIAAQQAAFDEQENAVEAHHATQRSTFHGAHAFIGSPTVMSPIAEIQVALIQLEAACKFEEGATTVVRSARREWRDNVCGAATLALGGAAPVTVVGTEVEPTFALMRTGAVYDVDSAWGGALQPSAPPAPGNEMSTGLLRAPRDSHMNDHSFDARPMDENDVKNENKNTTVAPRGGVELTPMAPMSAASYGAPVTTTATSYRAVSIVELRTQLLKLEAAITVRRQVSMWSKHSHFLRKKWKAYVASEDVAHCVGEDKLLSRLASGLLILDRSLEERVPMARKTKLVWRDQISNQGDVVCVWAGRRAWRQRLEGLGNWRPDKRPFQSP